MPIQVVSAEFLQTSTKPSEWPRGDFPEFAFVGRSNVGKSSMLNALTGKKKLARVSNTPGRTRALQFFEVRYRPNPAARARVVRFCDLPGYGYAKVSKDERAKWTAMIEDYLKERHTLRAVVLIVDARHEPMESDHDALQFLSGAGRMVVVAATKMDKLARTRRGLALRAAEKSHGARAGQRRAVLGGGGDRHRRALGPDQPAGRGRRPERRSRPVARRGAALSPRFRASSSTRIRSRRRSSGPTSKPTARAPSTTARQKEKASRWPRSGGSSGWSSRKWVSRPSAACEVAQADGAREAGHRSGRVGQRREGQPLVGQRQRGPVTQRQREVGPLAVGVGPLLQPRHPGPVEPQGLLRRHVEQQAGRRRRSRARRGGPPRTAPAAPAAPPGR